MRYLSWRSALRFEDLFWRPKMQLFSISCIICLWEPILIYWAEIHQSLISQFALLKTPLDKPCNFSHCKIDKVLSCSDSYMLERSPLAVTAASNRLCKGPSTFITQISTRIDCFWFKINQANWRIVKNIIKSQFFQPQISM